MSGAMAEAMAFDERDTRANALPYINVMGPGLACAVWAQFFVRISMKFKGFIHI